MQRPVYKDATDPDYQSVRDLVAAAVKRAWASPGAISRHLRAIELLERIRI